MTDLMSTPLRQRHDFVFLFDVTDGNPNGDPDAGNMPRIDPETQQGIVTDVSLKRKVRNYVALARAGDPGFEIYVREGAILNDQHRRAYESGAAGSVTPDEMRRGVKDKDRARAITAWMCENFYDIRCFGAVMSTGVNAGQVRGPLQLSFGRSLDAISPMEIVITRRASTTQLEHDTKGGRTIGRKYIVPYGLYRVHGHVNAALLTSPASTGFSLEDLQLFFESLLRMFETSHSAQSGEMVARKLVVFRHDSALGMAPSHLLFERVRVMRRPTEASQPPHGPPRRFSDYHVDVDQHLLPRGVSVLQDEEALNLVR